MSQKVFPIKSTITQTAEPMIDSGSNSRDLAMLKALELVEKRPIQKNLTPVSIQHSVTRKTRVVLALLPEWGAHIAPYNLARITALSRAAGFETRCYDINVDCYSKIDQAYWDNYKDWKWTHDDYYTEIHPLIEPILNSYIEKIVDFDPHVVGFSIFTTSNKATTWMIQQIRQRLPNVKILAGGPSATQGRIENTDIIDHIVVGEGEAIFLELMEKIEAGIPITQKFFEHDKNVRIDLDSLPYPDYSDMDLSLYQQHGVAAELSRGCVAKCQFCSETTFWRYRGRSSNCILDEIEYQYKTKGIQSVWFIDSLVNGNLKELLAFSQGLIDRKISITWMGYARCDKRMDLEYCKVLKAAGCHMLSFGIESGSQHVLDLMKKNVKVIDIEQNLHNFTLAGIIPHSNWIIGYPGEELKDIADTFTLLWRSRNTNLFGRSNTTCQVGFDAPLGKNREHFGIDSYQLAHQWKTKDFTNTIFHRIIRYKSLHVLLNNLIKNRKHNHPVINERPNIEDPKHCVLKYDPRNIVDEIPYENFDYEIIKIDSHTLNKTVVNEIWPLLRVLWLSVGPYELELKFDPAIDTEEFGIFNLPRMNSFYKARYKFVIGNDGKWNAEFDMSIHVDGQDHPPIEFGQDFDFDLKWNGDGVWVRPDPLAFPITSN